ncbi:MAG TPA: helix-turn-helix transcriptional regulator [Vicinamibacterales bacterium]|jgi:AraC-like DNA-binding protein|nr:helix-turn-helix transcriptional regulator [Vicinamibacterales bacterium]
MSTTVEFKSITAPEERQVSREDTTDRLISIGGLAPWQKRRVTELLNLNLAARLQLSHLAQECSLSISHFARSFKTSFGESAHRWIVQRRIECSQELLIQTRKPLADIANQAGFADQAAFTRTFSRIVGISPGRWRRYHNRVMAPLRFSRPSKFQASIDKSSAIVQETSDQCS